MEKLISALKSKTIWSLIALFVINGIGGVHDSIPAVYLPFIDAVIAFVGIYGRINPVQKF